MRAAVVPLLWFMRGCAASADDWLPDISLSVAAALSRDPRGSVRPRLHGYVCDEHVSGQLCEVCASDGFSEFAVCDLGRRKAARRCASHLFREVRRADTRG